MIFIFDRGEIVERGTDDQLVARGGVYAGLYESWLGDVREEWGTLPGQPVAP